MYIKNLKCQKLCSKKDVCSASHIFKIGSHFCYLYKMGNGNSSHFKVYVVNEITQWKSTRKHHHVIDKLTYIYICNLWTRQLCLDNLLTVINGM